MKAKEFDEIIRDKLDHIAPPSDVDVWSIFERKLDAEMGHQSPIDDNQFDQQIKDEITTISPTFKEKHWDVLNENLVTIDTRKNRIVVSKIMEVAAIFLIVFTFFHFSGTKTDYEPYTPVKADPVKFAATPIEVNKSEKIAVSPKVIISKQIEQTNNPTSTAKIAMVLAENSNKTTDNNEPAHPNGDASEPSDMEVLASNVLSTNVLSSDVAANDSSIKVNADQGLAIDLANAFYTDLLANEVVGDDNSLLPYGLTDVIDIQKLDNDPQPVYPEMAESYPMNFVQPVVNAKYSISAYSTADVNLINTPFDKLYSLASYNKEALNNSFGVLMATEKNNVEIETGLGYSKRIYQPEIITEAYGKFGENYWEKSLNKISFDIVNVPLNIKYHFINNHAWSTYIMAGASLNLIMNAKYDIGVTLKHGQPANRNAPEVARLDEKEFTQGLLNDGSIANNYFASVGFGFGIEKKIYNNTSIYIQPSYQRHVLSSDIGIGPNRDKIHTASLQVGVKTLFN